MSKQKYFMILRRLCGLLLVLICLCANGKTAYGAGNIQFVSLNGQWVDGNCMAKDDVCFYEFTIPKAGMVSFEAQGLSLEDSWFTIFNADMTKEYRNIHIYSASMTNPQTVRLEDIVLEAGKYILKVSPYSGGGAFRFRGTFEEIGNNEKEPNNVFAQAHALSLGQMVTGVISEDDELDFYSFTITRKQRIKIEFRVYFSQLATSIWNDDYICVHEGETWGRGGDKATPANEEYSDVLEPGTYYVKLLKIHANNGSQTGKYTVKYTTITPVEGITVPSYKKMEVGASSLLTADVIPSDATEQGIKWETSNSDVVSVDEMGRVIAKSPGKAMVTAVSKDNEDIKGICTITVSPKVLYLLKIKSLSKRRMKITWKKQSNISGYQIQYAINKNLKKAKNKKIPYYHNSLIVNSLKKKKTYYVRGRAYWKDSSSVCYGAWSKIKKVKIKK